MCHHDWRLWLLEVAKGDGGVGSDHAYFLMFHYWYATYRPIGWPSGPLNGVRSLASTYFVSFVAVMQQTGLLNGHRDLGMGLLRSYTWFRISFLV